MLLSHTLGDYKPHGSLMAFQRMAISELARQPVLNYFPIR